MVESPVHPAALTSMLLGCAAFSPRLSPPVCVGGPDQEMPSAPFDNKNSVHPQPALPGRAARLTPPQPFGKLRRMRSQSDSPLLLWLVSLLLVQPLAAQTNSGKEFARSPRLQGLVDDAVRQTVEKFSAQKLQTNQLAVTLIDLADPQKPTIASYRGGDQIYPASVVKLFYLVAVHQWLEE